MTLGDMSAIVFTVLAALLAMPCLGLAFGAFCPRLASRAESRVTRHPFLTFLAGLFAGGLLLGLVAVLGQGNAVMKFMSAVLGFGGGLAAMAGMGGVAAHIGRRLSGPIDREHPWRAVLRGAIILDCAFLFPGIGWLMVFPATLVLGLGAAALSVFPSRSASPSAIPVPPSAAPTYVPPQFAVPVAAPAPAAFAVAGPEEVMHR